MRRSAGIPFYVIPALLTILLTAGLSSVWFICPRGPSPYEIYRDSLDFTPPVPLTFLPDSLTDGNIDCFFEEDDGLVLVDYKNSYMGAGRTEADIRRTYAGQIELYRQALEAATGKPVKEAYLYLFDTGKFIPM